MAKSIWNGTIMFGRTAVPIKVYSATRDRQIHFHQIHEPDGSRVEYKRICSKPGKPVPDKQIAKGYETSSGRYVLLSQAEIDAAAAKRSRLIELERFVPPRADRARVPRSSAHCRSYEVNRPGGTPDAEQ